ncbi:MAG: hypothetical protein KY468_08390 [Armatimonadetes bacterium]|nr:hypothetical protein [Armatimonadota bacterium]
MSALAFGGAAQAVTVKRGDVTRDNRITVADAIDILQHIVSVKPLNVDGLKIADVGLPAGVEVGDAVKILRFIVGLEGDLGSLELPDTLIAAVQNNETVISWPKSGKGFVRLTFTQNSKTVTLSGAVETAGEQERFRIGKQYTSRFPLGEGIFGNAYTAFREFVEKTPVSVEVTVGDAAEGPFSTSVGSMSITPVLHEYDKTMGDEGTPPVVTLPSPIPEQAQVGQTITVAGQTTGQIRVTAYSVPPGAAGFPVPTRLQSAQPTFLGALGEGLQANSDFRMEFKVDREGAWNVEVNRYDGIATINQPIYVGTGLPLLPGPLDSLLLPSSVVGAPVTQEHYDRFLAALNADRQRFGFPPVQLDPQLQKAAQDYANDMVARNFFGHTGVNGDSQLGDRADAAGVPVTTRVGENLAEHTTSEALEAGLMASAGHRATILSSQWKHVGIGIARRPNGMLAGVQVFGSPIGAYTYNADYFDGILLDAPLPSNFVAGQPYTINGKATKPATTVVVFGYSRADPNKPPVVFGPVTVGADGRFSVPVTFTPAQIDTYDFGIQRDENQVNTAIVAVTQNPITL